MDTRPFTLPSFRGGDWARRHRAGGAEPQADNYAGYMTPGSDGYKGYDFTRSYAPGASASGPHTRRQDIELSYGSGPGANSFGDDFSFSEENFGDFFNDVSDTFPSISQFG